MISRIRPVVGTRDANGGRAMAMLLLSVIWALTRIWRVFRVLPGQGGLGVGCFHYMGGVGAGDGVR